MGFANLVVDRLGFKPLKPIFKDLPPDWAEGRYHGAEEKKKKGRGRGGGGWIKAPPGGWSSRRNGTAVRIRARNMRLRSQVASRVLVARSARKK